MRGATPPFAQVTVIGMVGKVEASAERGTSTAQVATTVAVTNSGAEADCTCACARADAPARIAAARTVRVITIHSHMESHAVPCNADIRPSTLDLCPSDTTP